VRPLQAPRISNDFPQKILKLALQFISPCKYRSELTFENILPRFFSRRVPGSLLRTTDTFSEASPRGGPADLNVRKRPIIDMSKVRYSINVT